MEDSSLRLSAFKRHCLFWFLTWQAQSKILIFTWRNAASTISQRSWSKICPFPVCSPISVAGISTPRVFGWDGRQRGLHRDPNPNLFVQLAGRKVVRLLKPEHGRQLYERLSAAAGRAHMRGEDMMSGLEMEKLEDAVWNNDQGNQDVTGVEAVLESGDALVIPLGWWHAVRGVGKGANASVNWWFR
jgi:hypothetical protein